MGITINTSSTYGSFTTSKTRFTKGPGELQEVSAGQQQLSVRDGATFVGTPSWAAYGPQSWGPQTVASPAAAPQRPGPQAFAPQAFAPQAPSPQAYAPQAPAPQAYAPQAPAPQVSNRAPRFRDFDLATRAAYRDSVKQLSTSGRLYVKEDNGLLRRADPMEIKERLDRGAPVVIVNRVGSESSASGSSAWATASKERGLFTSGWNMADESSTKSGSQRVCYSSSPVTEWDSLDFASDGEGVRGVAVLPASGGSVVVSSSFEENWSRRANEQWGFFTEKNTASESDGFRKTEYTAD